MLTDYAVGNKQSLVVELVGPAGAGKTTLLQALNQRSTNIQSGVHLNKFHSLPFLLSNTLIFLPTFLFQYRHSRWFNWREARSMAYLAAWHRNLDRQTPYNSVEKSSILPPLTVFDHGPIFRLALLQEFGPEIRHSRRFEQWWNDMLKRWASTLDLIIWLDAPDTVLNERIHTRSVWHSAKEKSEQEVYDFLTRYRASYEQIIAKLTAHRGQTLLRFDTSQISPDQIIDEVTTALRAASINTGPPH